MSNEETKRLIQAMETIHRIAGDMLDRERRLGPSGDTKENGDEKQHERIAKLEAALTKIAHRDVPDYTAHGQVIVAREALEEEDE